MSRISRALVLVGVCLLLVAGCSSAPGGQSGSTASGIGDLPTFLPSASANVVAHGSADSPAMSYAGSPVVVQLATGHVTVDVQGPAFPPDTKLGADQVVCTFGSCHDRPWGALAIIDRQLAMDGPKAVLRTGP